MDGITETEMIEVFSEHGNEFTSDGNVRISMRGAFIMIDCLLEEINEGRSEKYVLHEEALGMDTFMQTYNIASIKDLQLLSASYMWERYLAEGAEVIFTNADGATIHFRTSKGKTRIFSIKLHYHNEVDAVFNKTEHFKDFIDKHWEGIAAEKVEGGKTVS